MKYRIESSQRILDDIFKVDESQVSFERFDGSMAGPVRCLRFVRGDSTAAIVFHRQSRRIILVQQFRYPAAGWMIEATAGALRPDEPPESGVRREVEEETGYRVDRLVPIATFYVSPGGSTERVFLFYAEVGGADPMVDHGGIAAEHEDIRIVRIPLAEAQTLLATGDIVDAKTIIALQWLLGSPTRPEVTE